MITVLALTEEEIYILQAQAHRQSQANTRKDTLVFQTSFLYDTHRVYVSYSPRSILILSFLSIRFNSDVFLLGHLHPAVYRQWKLICFHNAGNMISKPPQVWLVSEWPKASPSPSHTNEHMMRTEADMLVGRSWPSLPTPFLSPSCSSCFSILFRPIKNAFAVRFLTVQRARLPQCRKEAKNLTLDLPPPFLLPIYTGN